jgi:putative ABC transport system substrate-binding protein
MANRVDAFLGGLRDLGYVEGQTIAIEWRFSPAEGGEALYGPLLTELVGLAVDVIVLDGGSQMALAAKRATSTIPIVCTPMLYPVENGLVASLARPGGNLTGLTSIASGVYAKCLDLLREVVPGLARVAVLIDVNNPLERETWAELRGAADAAGIQAQQVDLGSAGDLEAAFETSAAGRAQAVIVIGTPFLLPVRKRLAELALQHHLPGITLYPPFAEAGLLMAYGIKGGLPTQSRHAAVFVDKILKGANPADLPVEQPTEFDLVVNRTTLNALGLTIPPNVASQVTTWIQ